MKPVGSEGKPILVRLERKPAEGLVLRQLFLTTDMPTSQYRFALAHEIGHHVLHESKKTTNVLEDYSVNANGWENREANRFALALLMPSGLVKDLVFRHKMMTNEMAQRFEISTVALSTQLKHLGLIS